MGVHCRSDTPCIRLGMRHPWTRVSPERRSHLLFPLMGLCGLATLWMGWLGQPIDVGLPGSGILALEFCWWDHRCADLMATWSHPSVALSGLYGDYLYMVVYAATLGLAVVQARPHLSARWARLGEPLAWCVMLAAGLDALENLALIRLVGGAVGPEAAVAFVCASIKFAILALGLGYAAAGALGFLSS